MTFSLKRAMAMISALALAACMATACDSDDEEEDGGNAPSTSKPSTSLNGTDWSKSGKSEIIDYLVSIGKLDSYFKTPEFMNKDVKDQGIGSECFCYGSECSYAGYERPELQLEITESKLSDGRVVKAQAAQIFGCDNVAADAADGKYSGAIRSCFRSSALPNIKPAIYFPRGTCALTMSKCTPDDKCPADDPVCDSPEKAKQMNSDTICEFAKFGDYEQKDSFTACPDESVLLDFVMNIELTTLKRKAKLDVRGCFPGCKADSDCHGFGIHDSITNEESQLKCVKTEANADGVVAGVCFDMRTVSTSNGGEGALHLVNPGKWTVE